MSIFARLQRRIANTHRRTLGLALLIAVACVPTLALADALVQVEVRSEAGQPVDGVVVLRSRGDGGETYQCTTSGGNCRIDGVPGGQYTATFTPVGGAPQPPRPVMIPPAGTVNLRVAAR